MGHALIARFDAASLSRIESVLDEAGIFGNNKMPYGKGCDREAANKAMPYHITLYRWSKEDDPKFLPRVEGFSFAPSRVLVTRAAVRHAGEDSLMLYLHAEPADNFSESLNALETKLHRKLSSSMHITLSISKDKEKIKGEHIGLIAHTEFPFYLNIAGMDMYHIWVPVRFSRSF